MILRKSVKEHGEVFNDEIFVDILGPANINLNLSEQKVTVNGKMDAQKVFEAVKKKFGNRILLLFPEAPKEEEKKDEKKEESKAQPNEPVSQFSQIHYE